MKKRFVTALLAATMVVSCIAGCGNNGAAEQEVTADTTAGEEETAQTVKPTYRTVTEAFDWGPAITKVILDMGTAVDGAALGTDTFSVSSERKYTGFDFATGEMAEVDSVVERNVLAVYVSDSEGNQNAEGTYVTIEMEVGPNLTEGSPFNYDIASGFNSYVETSYLISSKSAIATTDGGSVIVEETDAAGNTGNINVIADSFDCTGTYTDGDSGITLGYASYMPETAKEGETPLIIWLHGAGEGGTDPTIAIMGNKVVNLATEEIQQYFGETGAAILAPQTPTMWLDDGEGNYRDPADAAAGTSYYTEELMGLIEAYVAAHAEIDTNRIYIGGCSNGGYMTVNMVIEYPEYFAAAYPVCEAYAANWLTDAKIDAIKDIPMWLTAAKNDGTVPIFKGEVGADFISYTLELNENGEAIPLDDYSNALYDRLVAAGAENVHYSLFENVVDTSGNYFKEDGTTPHEYMGHWSWLYTLNNECVEEIEGVNVTIFEWLAQQSK